MSFCGYNPTANHILFTNKWDPLWKKRLALLILVQYESLGILIIVWAEILTLNSRNNWIIIIQNKGNLNAIFAKKLCICQWKENNKWLYFKCFIDFFYITYLCCKARCICCSLSTLPGERKHFEQWFVEFWWHHLEKWI